MAASVLRRSLLIWGLGHLALGDRRGWLLLFLQPLSIAATSLAALQLINGTLWLAVFGPLLMLLVAWLGQAIHAHRRAIALGAQPGGEIQIAAFLPFALTALTLFWLVGGRHGSPAATVAAYMEAWMANRPDAAAVLFSVVRPAQEIEDQWERVLNEVHQDLERGKADYGEESGLDPARPFNNIRVTLFDDSGPGRQFVVEIVRSERYAETVLGIPTAGQRTVVLSPVMLVHVDEHIDAWFPNSTWQITGVYEVDELAVP